MVWPGVSAPRSRASASIPSASSSRAVPVAFDFGAPAAEYTVKNGGCSSCPIRCYTEYDVDPLADYDLPTHNSNTCMPVLYGTRVYPDGVHDFKYSIKNKSVVQTC